MAFNFTGRILPQHFVCLGVLFSVCLVLACSPSSSSSVETDEELNKQKLTNVNTDELGGSSKKQESGDGEGVAFLDSRLRVLDELENGRGCSLPPEIIKPVKDAELEEEKRLGSSGGGWGGSGGKKPDETPFGDPSEIDNLNLNLKNLDLKECAWNGRVNAKSILILDVKASDASPAQSFVRPLPAGFSCKRIIDALLKHSSALTKMGLFRCENIKDN